MTMTTTDISPRTGKPKRKYTRRTVKSAAPKPTEQKQEEPTEEPAILSTEQMAEIVSNNILPKLKEDFTSHSERIRDEIVQTESDIDDLNTRLTVLRDELGRTDRTLKVLK